jgi:hypothetical protein
MLPSVAAANTCVRRSDIVLKKSGSVMWEKLGGLLLGVLCRLLFTDSGEGCLTHPLLGPGLGAHPDTTAPRTNPPTHCYPSPPPCRRHFGSAFWVGVLPILAKPVPGHPGNPSGGVDLGFKTNPRSDCNYWVRPLVRL